MDVKLTDTMLLQATGLVKRYHNQTNPAVDGLDLCLKKGDLLGLLGPNGAGKTTTISMLSTMLRPDAGSVEIAGVDALKNPRLVRPLIGFVPQELALYPSLTLRENLQFWGRLYGLRGQLLSQRLNECVQLVALSDCLDNRVDTFSGGMKRRANLAAGIIHKPQLLFLDEPTVGIDPQSRHNIIDKLYELNCNGMTMVYTSHYMEEVERLCSGVVIVDAGKIVCSGSAQQLLEDSGCDDLEQLFLQLTGKQLRDQL
ncbi:MAG: ABC transporter [Desulfobacteraceae bacterium 4572_35.1]|nr:MAG: ABC transporter [Desulfobacteraceae bacterium 4572_35.1]